MSWGGGIIQLYRKTLSEKMCTQQSRKVKWDMTRTLFLTLKLTKLLLLLSFSTRKHKSMSSRAILSKFFEGQLKKKTPTMPFGVVACSFSDNLSENNCTQEFMV